MSKRILLAVAITLVAGTSTTPAADRTGIKTTVQGAELQFEVSVDPEEKKVVVVPISDQKLDPPPQMRMKFLKKNNTASDYVELKTVSIPNTSGLSYAGKLDIWNSSYLGFEIQFRFDRKGWKAVRHEFSDKKPK